MEQSLLRRGWALPGASAGAGIWKFGIRGGRTRRDEVMWGFSWCPLGHEGLGEQKAQGML